MKIALIGYGKMGKAIEAAALKRGHEICLKVTSATPLPYEFNECDVAIECTGPETATLNIQYCLEANIPIVVGSTGWYANFEQIKNNVTEKKGTLLYATNFSIGVHLFWEACKKLSSLMSTRNDYAVSITEIHHTAKKDAPSGTAITTAEIILEEQETLKYWKLVNESEVNNHDELMIKAIREGDAKGTHIVTYQSDADKIELKHEAFSRDGFAFGAVMAAEFIQNKKGVFAMRDVLHSDRKQD